MKRGRRNAARIAALLLGLGVACAAPGLALAQDGGFVTRADVSEAIGDKARGSVAGWYKARGNRPLWIAGGQLAPAAEELLSQMLTSEADGIDGDRLKPERLSRLLRRAAEKPSADRLAEAELGLSNALAAYVIAMRQAPHDQMAYQAEVLTPVVPTPAAVLGSAASAASLEGYVHAMGWMHPLYAPLRQALVRGEGGPSAADSIQASLARIRAIPAMPAKRYVLIDAAGMRLYMYENGKPTGSMRVVVGKTDQPTPMIAGLLRYAIVNPYWNVPTDLVRSKIATNVIARGPGYLSEGPYQLLSGYDDDAKPVSASEVDWPSVLSGERELRVRQLPGKGNFMGQVKFMFPNDLGIYLHDTPEKDLMKDEQRLYSSGCVRLEDASTLGRWLLGKPLPAKVKKPEQRIDLPEPVPVYITYLTAFPEKGAVSLRQDVYHRDGPVLATLR